MATHVRPIVDGPSEESVRNAYNSRDPRVSVTFHVEFQGFRIPYDILVQSLAPRGNSGLEWNFTGVVVSIIIPGAGKVMRNPSQSRGLVSGHINTHNRRGEISIED